MSTKVLVGNLPVETSEESLKELFDDFGVVVEVSLPRSPRGKIMGFAFVEMSTRQEAVSASKALTNFELSGRRLTVSLKKQSESKSAGLFGFLKSFKSL